MNLRELIDLTINKSLEYIVESDHDSFLEELVDDANAEGIDSKELYGINDALDAFLSKNNDEEDDDHDGDY